GHDARPLERRPGCRLCPRARIASPALRVGAQARRPQRGVLASTARRRAALRARPRGEQQDAPPSADRTRRDGRLMALSADWGGSALAVDLWVRRSRGEEDTMAGSTAHELAYRESPDAEVTLLWHPDDDTLSVTVVDAHTGESFVLAAGHDEVFDVFMHPFAHASFRGVSGMQADCTVVA